MPLTPHPSSLTPHSSSTPLPLGLSLTPPCRFVLAWVWNYLTFVRHARTCVTFCRAVSGIPILKVRP